MAAVLIETAFNGAKPLKHHLYDRAGPDRAVWSTMTNNIGSQANAMASAWQDLQPTLSGVAGTEDAWNASFASGNADTAFSQNFDLAGNLATATDSPTSLLTYGLPGKDPSDMQQKMDWNSIAAPQQPPANWPTETPSRWADGASQTSQQPSASTDIGTKSGHQAGPMPIPERSNTEPLWQRRLNAKNKELQQLHSRLSAPDLAASEASPSSPFGLGDQTINTRQSSSFDPSADHDFTHASPDTLRMLHLDGGMSSNMAGAEFSAPMGSNIVNPSSVSASGLPVGRFSSTKDLTQIPDMSTFAIDDGHRQAQIAYLDPFTGNSLPQMTDAGFLQPTSGQTDASSRSTSSMDDEPRSPRSFVNGARARRIRGLSHGSMQVQTGDMNGHSYSVTSPQSATSMSSTGISSGKGVISKVIVPSAPGVPSDAVDLRTGEAGQMRHMCPFPGCDKHFSTSGHARRHSRIHDCLRPFECPHEGCHATFTRRDNCTQHQRARHKYQLVAHRIGGDD